MVDSVQAALPPNCSHVIISEPGDYAQLRMNALSLNRYVVFVDDDDYISSSWLKLCLNALEQYKAGVAFTNVVRVDANGERLPSPSPVRRYDDMYVTPLCLQKMCIVRTDAVDPSVLDMAEQFGVGIDWFIQQSRTIIKC